MTDHETKAPKKPPKRDVDDDQLATVLEFPKCRIVRYPKRSDDAVVKRLKSLIRVSMDLLDCMT